MDIIDKLSNDWDRNNRKLASMYLLGKIQGLKMVTDKSQQVEDHTMYFGHRSIESMIEYLTNALKEDLNTMRERGDL